MNDSNVISGTGIATNVAARAKRPSSFGPPLSQDFAQHQYVQERGTTAMERDRIFISYSHVDKKWLEELRIFLSQLETEVDLWDDTKLAAGDDWRIEIDRAVKSARIAILLISAHFINSEFIQSKELPPLLEAAESGGTRIIPLIARHCNIPPELARFQAVNAPNKPLIEMRPGERDELFSGLAKDLELRLGDSKGSTSKGTPPVEFQSFGAFAEPIEASSWWPLVEDCIRRPIFDVMPPSYILDLNYRFMDWNPAFDELVAKQCRLERGNHAVIFVEQLLNKKEVVKRAQSVFGGSQSPITDTEVLKYVSEKYGLIKFQKLATKITNEKGEPQAWVVTLNVIGADRLGDLWADVSKRLTDYANWSRYATSYDRLLQPFDDYNQLLDKVVDLIGDARTVVDLGAGTGNGTVRLLQRDSTRQVWAVDNNNTMLEHLRQKVVQLNGAITHSEDRFVPLKCDIERMGEIEDGTFDAAVMINTLFSVQNPQQCLREAHRILKPGGILAFSTPHRDTDVDALFAKLKTTLIRKGKYQSLKSNLDVAEEVHLQMKDKIHRDTLEDIRNYVESAGFGIDEMYTGQYVNSVVVVKAHK